MQFSEYDKRAAIAVALHAGRKTSELSKFLNLPIRTVYRLRGNLTSPARKKHTRRSDTKRTEKSIGIVAGKVAEDPRKSMTRIAAEMNVHQLTIS